MINYIDLLIFFFKVTCVEYLFFCRCRPSWCNKFIVQMRCLVAETMLSNLYRSIDHCNVKKAQIVTIWMILQTCFVFVLLIAEIAYVTSGQFSYIYIYENWPDVTYAISAIKRTKTKQVCRIIQIVTICAFLTLQWSIDLYKLDNIVSATKHRIWTINLLHHDGRQRQKNRYSTQVTLKKKISKSM